MSTIIYHNPRCSKSREALKLLKDNGIEPTVKLYLDTPPSVSELKNLLKQLKLDARDIVRTKETIYKDLGLNNTALTEADLIEALHKHPILIERPIVVHGNAAIVARPGERVLEII